MVENDCCYQMAINVCGNTHGDSFLEQSGSFAREAEECLGGVSGCMCEMCLLISSSPPHIRTPSVRTELQEVAETWPPPNPRLPLSSQERRSPSSSLCFLKEIIKTRTELFQQKPSEGNHSDTPSSTAAARFVLCAFNPRHSGESLARDIYLTVS